MDVERCLANSNPGKCHSISGHCVRDVIVEDSIASDYTVLMTISDCLSTGAACRTTQCSTATEAAERQSTQLSICIKSLLTNFLRVM